MNWISSNWEKVVLLLVSLLVILISAIFVKHALQFGSTLETSDLPPDGTLPATERDKVDSAKMMVALVEPWKTPVRGGAAAKDVPLFVSVPIVEIDGRPVDILDPNEKPIRPPVSNKWLRDNGLDFTSATVLSDDADGDHFSNIDEWTAKTSPIDAESHPSYALKLVMVSRRQQSYVVEFVGKPDDNSFQINRHPSNSYGRDVFITGLGEITEDGKLKLEKYEPIEALNAQGIRVNASKLTVTYVDTGESITLVRGEKFTVPTYFLEVSYKLGELEKKFYKAGEEIVLPNAPDTKYKLVDIEENSANVSYLDANGDEKKIPIKKQN